MIERLRSLLVSAVAAVALSAAAAQAQQASPAVTSAPAAREAPAAPSRDAARVAFSAQQQQYAALDVESMRRQQGAGFGHAEALMIVGGAAFVAGLIIGGDAGTIVMLGGAGIGLYGLYLYLQ